MSIDTHHSTAEQSDTSAPPSPRRGPVGRIIAGSLGAGATTALVLALVVFAGETESVITGSILLGFGFGWAMMAALSVRLTGQPQRWATVPAVAMAATGLVLLVCTPGDVTLARLGWLWPPLMLALVAWMFVQMRRSLTGPGRWLLVPVFAVLALAAVGGGVENVALLHVRNAYAAPGATYDVGGHKLHLDCHGHGDPTVVLENGLGEISASWARITEPVARTTRVCAYDRAGQGWSEDSPRPQDGVTAARDLHTLLDVAGEHGPYVLVGHSIGGAHAMTYAARYPDQVAGMVLLDSSSPEQFTTVASYPGQYAMMRRGLALTPTLTRLGLGWAVPGPELPAPAAAQVRALSASPRAARIGRDELATIPDLFKQAQALTTLQDRPLAVLTASESLSGAGWAAAQDRMAALSTNAIHRTADSTHEGLVGDPHGAAESVRAINQVVSAVRSNSHERPLVKDTDAAAVR